MSWWLSRQAGQVFPDSQCGFRLVHLESWHRLRLRTRRFEVESEMLEAFAAAGCGIAFVPVRVRPARRPSRIHPWRDTFRWLRWRLGATSVFPWSRVRG